MTERRNVMRRWRGGVAAVVLGLVPVLVAACGGSPAASAGASAGAIAAASAAPATGSVAIYVHTREVAPPVSSPDLATTAWPFTGDPASFGEPFTSTLDAWPDGRCAVLDSPAATAAIAALPNGLLTPIETAPGWSSGTLGWSARRMDVLLMVEEIPAADAGRPCGELWLAHFDPAGG